MKVTGTFGCLRKKNEKSKKNLRREREGKVR